MGKVASQNTILWSFTLGTILQYTHCYLFVKVTSNKCCRRVGRFLYTHVKNGRNVYRTTPALLGKYVGENATILYGAHSYLRKLLPPVCLPYINVFVVFLSWDAWSICCGYVRIQGTYLITPPRLLHDELLRSLLLNPATYMQIRRWMGNWSTSE